MAIIARLAGEGIGPFKSFDFDFSDSVGNPHPGPHIFAGINGSGKSTVLRTLAWMSESKPDVEGFKWQDWQHAIQGHDLSQAMVVFVVPGLGAFAEAQTMDITRGWEKRLGNWARGLLRKGKIESLIGELPITMTQAWPKTYDDLPKSMANRPRQGLIRLAGPIEKGWFWADRLIVAGYGPSRLLKHLPEVNLSSRLADLRQNGLSFDSTVHNEAIQSWLLGLFSKRAIARERGQSVSKYSTSLGHFEESLKLMCGQDVAFSVDIEPSLQPRLLMYHKRLDFSQLPDGVRSTVGWLADFLMRLDSHEWRPEKERANVLLLDEVDAHLHPKWQRSILPSIKQAMPEVQVFVTSHSPFVIASCPGARIHMLDLDEEGRATNRPPEDAPIGESVLATMKDIFGVNSRFDVDTERLLDEWNQLRRQQAKEKLSAKEKSRLKELVRDLSVRSEELRQIVLPVVPISDSLIASLAEKEPALHGAKTKTRK